MRHRESRLQIACVRWFDLQYPDKFLMAIPNGGKRSVLEAAFMKKEGVRAGVSDLFLAEPSGRYHGLWIEMKTETGRTTKKQEQFIKLMIERGYMARVANSFDSFVSIVNNYLKHGKEEGRHTAGQGDSEKVGEATSAA
jgi:hypothetical protein